MRKLRNLWWLALGLAACAIPFNYPLDLLSYLEVEGTFQVNQGGISPNPKTLGPVQVTYTPDPRITLSGATLELKVCFTSETPGATFSGDLNYAAYLGGDAGNLFDPGNQVAQGSGDVSGLNNGPVCVEKQASLSPTQLQAVQSGVFYVAARISGTAQSSQEATIRYRAEVFRLHLSGTAGR
ncbi:hypothetical protein [Thermus thalpophilus]|uniref:hypothetical protein n=1 Tax=Thermus thalpophilus TaxID=2908147 RepID=UPI001FA98A7D|nr:hypothetical protein [Thermus thalpophilus]